MEKAVLKAKEKDMLRPIDKHRGKPTRAVCGRFGLVRGSPMNATRDGGTFIELLIY